MYIPILMHIHVYVFVSSVSLIKFCVLIGTHGTKESRPVGLPIGVVP